ncbi:MAG: 4Fe-4S binding protein [Actinobacteria bacterium]|nr:4Fe-4S binding protein [Actinomycetota bacterium]
MSRPYDGADRAHELTPELRAAADVVGAPAFVAPWLDRFYDAGDVDLLLAAADDSLDGVAEAELERGVRRAVLDRGADGAYSPADFHARLEIWAMFEGWKDVPLAVHRQLADWDVDAYAERIRADVEAVRDGRSRDSYEARYTYVLLDEARTIVSAQDRIYLWPCDCRSIVGACRKLTHVCLRFENDRGLGWEISRERALDILLSSDKAGLMHTADLRDDPAGSSAICNCCTNCCYPHLAAERLGTEDAWPVRRHLAHLDMDLCTSCGRCGLRCPFEAIVCSSSGRPTLDPARCPGCGLCATGCSADAIAMRPLKKA